MGGWLAPAMKSNMYSTGPPDGLTKLAALAATVDRVIAQDLDRLGEAALADHARARYPGP